MNELNYASLVASKNLHDAGIVLETDFVWRLGADGWKLLTKDWVRDMMSNTYESIPAPSMAEVWRELPWVTDNYGLISMNKADNVTYCGYRKGLAIREPKFESNNPTDALIDLLIWVREGK